MASKKEWKALAVRLCWVIADEYGTSPEEACGSMLGGMFPGGVPPNPDAPPEHDPHPEPDAPPEDPAVIPTRKPGDVDLPALALRLEADVQLLKSQMEHVMGQLDNAGVHVPPGLSEPARNEVMERIEQAGDAERIARLEEAAEVRAAEWSKELRRLKERIEKLETAPSDAALVKRTDDLRGDLAAFGDRLAAVEKAVEGVVLSLEKHGVRLDGLCGRVSGAEELRKRVERLEEQEGSRIVREREAAKKV